MRLPTRQTSPVPTGVAGPVRKGRPTHALLRVLEPGDVAVIDHVDLDRATAQALVDARVTAVVNVQPMFSGRYASLGAEVLARAGVTLLEGVGEAAFAKLPDDEVVRLRDGAVYDGERVLAQGRELTLADVRAAMEQARSGMQAQLETFAHNSTEVLRREQDLLLNGVGLPTLETRIRGRAVLVVSDGADVAGELRRAKRFLREQRPAVIAVGGAADRVRDSGVRADVVVVAPAGAMPSAKVLRAARDVVVCRAADAPTGNVESLTRMGIAPRAVVTSMAPEDAALLLASREPAVVVGVGLTATLEEFLDRRRPGLAGTYLSRLVVGPRLVDAAVAERLYTGRVRPWHVLLTVVAGLAAVAAAVASTPIGNDWAVELVDQVQGLLR